MRKLVSILTLLVLWPPSQSPAQLYPPNEAGVSLSAWHTIVRDVEATKKFWALFCGTPMKIEGIEVMKIPGVLVFLHPGEPSGPSAGAVIDHVGFSCQNCYELVKRLVDAGVKTDRLNPETMRNPNWKPGGEPSRAWTYAYTPDGLKIEIETSPCTLGSIYAVFAPRDPSVPCPERMPGAVQTDDRAGAMGSDQLHFHLNSDIDVKGIYNFYTQFFGGKLVRYSNLNVVIPGTIMLLVTSAQPRPFNKGRALDSIGFEVRNLEQFAKKLEAAGMKFDQPYSKTRYQSFAHAAFTDPWGTPVQLTEGLGRLAPAAPPKGRGELAGGAAKGKQVFDLYCSYCHSTTSNDVQYADAPGLKGFSSWPPHKLRDGTEHKEHTDEALRKVIVLGTDRSGGRMPATGIVLSDQELNDVLAYLKTL